MPKNELQVEFRNSCIISLSLLLQYPHDLVYIEIQNADDHALPFEIWPFALNSMSMHHDPALQPSPHHSARPYQGAGRLFSPAI
jgi:hypothetical protein